MRLGGIWIEGGAGELLELAANDNVAWLRSNPFAAEPDRPWVFTTHKPDGFAFRVKLETVHSPEGQDVDRRLFLFVSHPLPPFAA